MIILRDMELGACEEYITAKLENQRARRGVYTEQIEGIGKITCTQTLCKYRHRNFKDYWRTSWLLDGKVVSRKFLDVIIARNS